MFAVIECSKFKEAVVANVGNSTIKELSRMGPSECPICGPCSHVEFSFGNLWTEHGRFETEAEAQACLKAKREMVQ